MNFKLDNKMPIYVQIVDYMKKKIIIGEFKGGDRLPSVRDFASEIKVNPNTVQRVYAELEGDELIYTQRGIGKFVTEDKNVVSKLKKDVFNDTITGFIKESKELGFTKEELISIIHDIFEEV